MPARFVAAAERFEQAHRDDPRIREGEPYSVLYHRQVARWLALLAPEASEALRLAARAQHIRRWTIPRARFPEGRSGYRRWRIELGRFHAAAADAVLAAVGYDEMTRRRVGELLVKKGLGGDAEVQVLEDAVCLAFLELELTDFAAKHDDEKLVSILQKTWKKMSPAGHAAALELVATLPERERALIQRALG
jgi:hypothetical protein